MARLLHLTNHCRHGHGNVHAAVDLACAQAARGHQVGFASEGGFFEGLLQHHGVAISRLPQNVRKPWRLATSIASLSRQIRRERVDIVHAHMMSGAVIGFAASRICRIPLVTTVHNSFDWHARLMNLGDAVVAVSEAELVQLQEEGFAKAKLHAVWNGPLGSPRYVSPRKHLADHRSKTIVTVCGLHPRKGVGDLLEAFADVSPGAPGWRLAIVGDGPDKDRLIARCHELDIQASTTFLGSVDDPSAFLSSAEIYVAASHAEPFGLSVVEARNAGCAIVATNVGGLPEVTDFGAAAILVKPRSRNEIAGALRRLIAEPTLRHDLQKAASSGLERFNVERLAAEYDQVYDKVMASRSRQRPDTIPVGNGARGLDTA